MMQQQQQHQQQHTTKQSQSINGHSRSKQSYKSSLIPIHARSKTDTFLLYALAIFTLVYTGWTIHAFRRLPGIPSLEVPISSSSRINVNRTEWAVSHINEYAATSPFPISISKEEMEEIVHPAAEEMKGLKAKEIPPLLVPPFWDPPIFQPFGGVRKYLGNNGDRLMTVKEAQTIGSFSKQKETIFVAISSYRDYQCRQTIESIYDRAANPHRIRVAVVDQLSTSDGDKPCSEPVHPCETHPHQVLCQYSSQMDFFEMDAKYAVGPVFARHLGHRMYRGEYFAMQCDAHVDFVQDWDESIISQWKSAKNEMAVLSAYLSDITDSIDPQTHMSLRKTRPIMCMSDYEGWGQDRHLRHGQQPEGPALIHGEPTLEPFWAAGFSFSRGHFVVNVPYDQHLPMIFQGEEISIGLRGFTYGYDYYTAEKSICFHYYASASKNSKRKNVKLFWENSSRYKGVATKGMKRLNGIIGMLKKEEMEKREWNHADEEKYGLGKVRTTQKFFDTFGIDTEEEKIQQHLCQFVGKNMMKKWKPHLREDRMGINYDAIDFRFKDPDIYGRNGW